MSRRDDLTDEEINAAIDLAIQALESSRPKEKYMRSVRKLKGAITNLQPVLRTYQKRDYDRSGQAAIDELLASVSGPPKKHAGPGQPVSQYSNPNFVRVYCPLCRYTLGVLEKQDAGWVNVDKRMQPVEQPRMLHVEEYDNWEAHCKCGFSSRLRGPNLTRALGAVTAAGLKSMPFKGIHS